MRKTRICVWFIKCSQRDGTRRHSQRHIRAVCSHSGFAQCAVCHFLFHRASMHRVCMSVPLPELVQHVRFI